MTFQTLYSLSDLGRTCRTEPPIHDSSMDFLPDSHW